MKFDLTFTGDNDWIENRLKCWQKIEGYVAEELTRKQLEVIKEYFFTGIVPKGKRINPTTAVLFFPAYTKEALEFVFWERVSFNGSINEDRLFKQIQADASLNLDFWPGAENEEKISIFKILFGDHYDPDRKFPFLINGEKEFREYSYSASDLFSIVLGRFLVWCKSEGKECSVWPDLVDYMLSLIPYVEPWVFKEDLSDSERYFSVGGVDARYFSNYVDDLMRYILRSGEVFFESPYLQLKNQKLQKIAAYLDDLESPEELVSRWRKAKL